MSNWQFACLVAYCTTVFLLSVYSFHQYQLLRLYRRHRGISHPPAGRFADLPQITVQLPLYNESHVVERLLGAVARLDYPRDRLQIQVLDDSEDETQERARQQVQQLVAQGFDIEYLHRPSREGFKAGALAAGLERAKGEFILILDADFVPPPSMLRQSIHYFVDPQIGMVQMRWGYLNRSYSLLTRLQSISLDGHFVIEHTARSRSGYFFNFNGTAGIWRRQAILDAGGWQHDTLTEDLDLSYRAQLAGWKFVFLPEIEVPSEIPVEMNALKAQQHRWTKGAVQTAKKVLPRLWRTSLPLRVKVEATFHLTSHLGYLLLLLLALLALPVLELRSQMGWKGLLIVDLPLLSFAILALSGFYLASQRALYPDWKRQIKYLPMLMALGAGLCLNNSRAAVEGLTGHQSPFLRTPKYGVTAKSDRLPLPRPVGPRPHLALGELALGAYSLLALERAWTKGLYAGIPFLLIFCFGFFYTGAMSGLHLWLAQRGLCRSS